MPPLSRTISRIVNARLRDGSVCDVDIVEGSIASVVPAAGTRVLDSSVSPARSGELDLDGFILIPAPAEPHAHLDKALLAEGITLPVGDLDSAIDWIVQNSAIITEEEVFDRALRSALRMLQHGTTAIRTHVDTPRDGDSLRGIRALTRVKEELAAIMDIQIVVLTSSETPTSIIDEALDISGGILGGASHLMADPIEDLDRLLAIADRRDIGFDLHADESLHGPMTLPHLARRTREWAAHRTVVAGHCVRLSTLTAAELDAVIEDLVDSRVAVVSLPITNLYLQGWDEPISTPRGIAPLRRLIDRGVRVAAGADNVRDPFNPVGRSDALETASLLVTAGHLTIDEAYRLVSTDARSAMGLPEAGIFAGARAELLAVRATDLGDVVATASMDRHVIHAGRLVASSALQSHIAWPGSAADDAPEKLSQRKETVTTA